MLPGSTAHVFSVSSLQGLFAQSHCSQKQTLSGEHAVRVVFSSCRPGVPGQMSPVGFTQQLNVGPLSQPHPQSDGRPGCQCSLPEKCWIVPDSAGTGCSSFGTLRLRSRHPLSSLSFFFLLLFWEVERMLGFEEWQVGERELGSGSVWSFLEAKGNMLCRGDLPP